MILKKGEIVLRCIEGMVFTATIIEVNRKDELVVLQYLDDGNIENAVSFDEIQQISSKDKNYDTEITSYSKIETLPRPLAGLVEDDYESRKNHTPTVFIHENAEGDAAIILNGAENRLAAGGGLRALRYLKK